MSNNRLERSISFPLTHALLMMRAFMKASTEALMNGSQAASEAMRAQQDAVMAMLPSAALLFSPEHLCEMGEAMVDASSFDVHVEKPSWHHEHYWTEGHIHVTIALADGIVERWTSKSSSHRKNSTEIEQVHAFLMELAPLDCDGVFDLEGGEGSRQRSSTPLMAR